MLIRTYINEMTGMVVYSHALAESIVLPATLVSPAYYSRLMVAEDPMDLLSNPQRYNQDGVRVLRMTDDLNCEETDARGAKTLHAMYLVKMHTKQSIDGMLDFSMLSDSATSQACKVLSTQYANTAEVLKAGEQAWFAELLDASMVEPFGCADWKNLEAFLNSAISKYSVYQIPIAFQNSRLPEPVRKINTSANVASGVLAFVPVPEFSVTAEYLQEVGDLIAPSEKPPTVSDIS